MDSKERKQRVAVPQAKRIAIYEALKVRILKLDNGMCKYLDPEDGDQKVADAFGVTNTVVKNLRNDIFGSLLIPQNVGKKVKASTDAFENRLARVERLVEHLYDALSSIVDHPDANTD